MICREATPTLDVYGYGWGWGSGQRGLGFWSIGSFIVVVVDEASDIKKESGKLREYPSPPDRVRYRVPESRELAERVDSRPVDSRQLLLIIKMERVTGRVGNPRSSSGVSRCSFKNRLYALL